MGDEWYYSRDGEEHGPYSAAALVAMAKKGDLLPTDFLRKEGMTDWRLAGDFPKLFGTGEAAASKPKQSPEPPAVTVSPTPPKAQKTLAGSAIEASTTSAACKSADPSSLKGLTMALGIGPAESGHDPLLGRDIGGVTIVRLIAEGGMGRVYEGKQEKPSRAVAVKVMRPGLTSPSVLKRFEYEAEVLGRLQHPGIAHIYSVGVHHIGDATVPYFVMEYIADARTLTKYATDLKLPTRQRLDLFRSVCDAVAHGHQKGVIHRDLKPSNILVDASGQPKVIDFGVARATDSDMALTTMQTDVGQLIGTLQYMSPEQFKADPNDIDVRSDVYALGVILYELLAGKMPYDVKKKAIHEVAQIVQEDDPTPLSAFNRALKGDVAVIAGKCLEKDRGRRYSSASELGADVDRYLAGEPISASPPGFVDGLVRLARKHRAAALATVGVFVSLICATIGIAIFAAHAEDQRRTAERVMAFFSDTLRASNPRFQGKPTTLADVLRNAHARLSQDETFDRRAKAATLMVLAHSFVGLGLYEDASSASMSAYTLRTSLDGPRNATALESLCLFLESKLGSGSSPGAIVPLAEKLLSARTSLLGVTHPATVEAMSDLAVAYRTAGRYDEAIALARKALDLRTSALGSRDRETLLAANNLAVSLRRGGHGAEAIDFYRRIVDDAVASLGEHDADTLLFLFNFGVAQYADKEFTEAADLLRRVYSQRRIVLGPDHPETLKAVAAFAKVLVRMDKTEEARTLLQPLADRLKDDPIATSPEYKPVLPLIESLFPEHFPSARLP